MSYGSDIRQFWRGRGLLGHLRGVVRLGACLACAAGAFPVGAQDYQVENSYEARNIYLERLVRVMSADGTNRLIKFRLDGGAWYQATAGASPLTLANHRLLVEGWEGLSPATSPLDFVSGAGAAKIVGIDWDRDGAEDFSYEVNLPETEVTVTHVIGVQSWQTVTLPPVDVLVGPDGEVTFDDPLGPGSEPPVDTSPGVLMFDLRVPGPLDIQLGDELLTLEPGYNFFPFDGQLDENGEFPQVMLDEEIPMIRKVGPDGNFYWYAQLTPGPDSTVQWNPSPTGPVEILPPSVSGGGPTLTVPGVSDGSTDYVGIPPGVLPGNNVPLPGGMEPGASSQLPPGVTPGAAGALQSGTVSGGANYLPQDVSPGIAPQPAPDPGSGGGGGGGGGGSIILGGGGGQTGSSAGAVTQTTGDAYSPGPSMDGMADEAKSKGAEWAEGVGQGFTEGLGEVGDSAKGFFGEGGFKFWEGDDPISGSDSSWLNFDLPIDHWTASIEIPPDIVALIRAILVWGVKIWFVVSVIRLFMK